MGRAPSLALGICILLILAVCGASASGQAEPAEGKKARKKAAEGAEVLVWNDQPLTEIKVVQRLMRLNKAGAWEPDRLPKLARMAVETDRKLLKQLGHWYLALTAGREGNPPQALEHLKSAVSLGYSNVGEIVDANEFSELRENPEFKALVEELTRKVEKEARDRFTARTDASFAASREDAGSPWVPDLKAASGRPLWQKGPAIVIVTRVHHEGFEKLLGRLKEIPAEKAKGVRLSVLFYQDDPANERRAAQAREYADKVAKKLGVEISHAVIGRKDYKDLDARMLARHEKVAAAVAPAAASADEDGAADPSGGPLNVFPLILGFFGNQGEFQHAICGVPELWQLEYALGKLTEAVTAAPEESREEPEPAPEPKPAEPAPPPAESSKPAAETPPAEKPAATAESPPPENGASPEEKKDDAPPQKPEGESEPKL